MFVSHWYEDRRLKLCADEAVGHTVLDVGFADMPNTYLEKRGLHVTGLDLAAPQRPCNYAETIQGDVAHARALLGDRTFDTIIAGELIEHLEQPYAFLRDLRSFVKPAGRLVLSTPNPLGLPVVFFELVGDRRRFFTQHHTFYFLPRWVERMLTRAGFTLMYKRAVGLWNPLVPLPAPPMLSYQIIYVARPT